MTESLGKLCQFVNGGTPAKSETHFFEGEIPWITSADITETTVKNARSFITEEAISASSTNKVSEGTVLLVTRTGVGKVAVAGVELCFSQDITALIADHSRLDTAYLVHFLRTKHDYFLSMARGATIKGITRDVVANLKLPLPSLSEQRRIAAILDQADALRAKRREALAQLDALTQSIFIEMFGDPATNPKGWKKITLESVAAKVTDGEHLTPRRVEAGIKLLSARNVRDGYLDFEDVDYIDEAEFTRISKRCNPERGDILISCSGSIGRVASVETDEPLALVRSAALVKPDLKKIRPKFLEAYLRTPFLNRLMVKSAHSSSQANLFQGPIRALPILLPSLEIQDEFVSHLQVAKGVREAHAASAQQLESLLQSLQHSAFRGEL